MVPDLSLLLTLALVPVLLWWAGTVIVLRHAHREKGFGPMALLTAALPLALMGLLALSSRPPSEVTVLASYGLVFVVWAWLEVSFYTGYVTGPVKTPCPADTGTVGRVAHGLASSAYHEAAMVALGLAIWLLSSGAAAWAPWFYLVLAGMHSSARLNVLLGVRNLNEHFLPQRLAYLGALFRERSMNALMPFSLLASAILTIGVALEAVGASGPRLAGLVIVAILAGLGTIEHLLLILPLPGHRLFEWGLPGHRG